MTVTILTGDTRTVLPTLPSNSVQTCVTSPPYFGLRDYGHTGQIGLEQTPEAYVAEMVALFREVRRVLKDDGTLWLNLGDSYAGSWGNQGRKEGGGTQREKTRPSFQKFSTDSMHAIECDMGEDCSCGADMGAIYPDRQTRTGSWVNDHPTLKAKDLIGIPWRVAFALQQPDAVCPFCEAVEHISEWTRGPRARYSMMRCPSCEEWSAPELLDGWYLRSDVIWHKPNPMPESVTDRPTKAHEYVFLLSKSARYFYDTEAAREPIQSDRAPSRKAKATGAGYVELGRSGPAYDGTGEFRNARTVWSIPTQPFAGAHFATMPPDLARRCILAGSKPGDMVLDPFGGAGTTGLVADRLGRHATLIELNPTYAEMARTRIQGDAPLFADVQEAA